jgi:putative DNA primase/helicase
LAGEIAKVRGALEGQRNAQLNKSAFALGTLIGGGELDQQTAETELLAAAMGAGLTAAEAQRTIASGMQAGIKKPRKIDAPTPPVATTRATSTAIQIHAWTPAAYITDRPAMLHGDFIMDCLGEEEYGDAKLLTKLYQGRLCYSTSEKTWYVWGGHAWYRDQWLLIRHLIAGQVARQYLLLASDSDSMTPKQEIEALAKRALKLRTLQRCNNIESFARSFLSITGEEWDRNPWLLGVANGVLDLRTGKLRVGQPTDYIRTVAPTVWKGIDAPAPRFEQFIQEIFDGSEPITGFIQRLLGYSITGLTVEHIFPVLWGERGRNGKDTLLETLKAVLGDCADTVSTDVLLAQNSRGSAQPHLIDLMGKRLVWASETSVNARLNEAQVKLVTGGGTIKARPLYGGMLQFAPTHLVLLITNHKPRANAEDDALWNRIVLLPFNLRFVAQPTEPDERQRDPHLRQKLTEERSGVLAWLVRGCMEWQRDGLNIPDEVRASTDSYREEEDMLGQFADECCTVHARAQVKASAFYKAYKEWAENAGMNPLNQTNFGNRMKKRFERKRTEAGFFYIGIGLLSSDPDPLYPNDPMIRKVHEESNDMGRLSAKGDQTIQGDHSPPPGQGEKAGQYSQGAADRAAEEGLQNGHSAYSSPAVVQGAGRREQISHARQLLKSVGTSAELATVDVAGMTDGERERFIAELERRSNGSN